MYEMYSRYTDNNELLALDLLCLTAVKKHVIKYCEKVYEIPGKIYFGL